MFWLRDLRFALCSRDLDVLRAQRIIGFLICITHKSMGSENPITLVSQITIHFGESLVFSPELKVSIL